MRQDALGRCMSLTLRCPLCGELSAAAPSGEDALFVQCESCQPFVIDARAHAIAAEARLDETDSILLKTLPTMTRTARLRGGYARLKGDPDRHQIFVEIASASCAPSPAQEAWLGQGSWVLSRNAICHN